MSVGDASGVPAMVLGSQARQLRRALGPTAWAVFEELLTEATVEDGFIIAHTNCGRVAAELGIGIDATAAAVRRQRALGLVDRVQPADERGRFAPGGYRLSVPAGLVLRSPWRDSPTTAEADPVCGLPLRRRSSVPTLEQPDLFESVSEHHTKSHRHPNQHADGTTPTTAEPAERITR